MKRATRPFPLRGTVLFTRILSGHNLLRLVWRRVHQAHTMVRAPSPPSPQADTPAVKKPFKQRYSFEERKKEADKIFAKYPERLPIICERGPIKAVNVPDLDRNKFLVSRDTSMGAFQSVIRRRLATDESTALFFFVGGNKMAPSGETVFRLYEKYKCDDGFLYVTYTGENTLG